MSNSRGRTLLVNRTAVDQADFFQGDGFHRVQGLKPSDVAVTVFCNNSILTWPVLDGVSTTDAQIKSGYVYFHEIPSAAGHYSLRFRPNAIGYWRVTLSYTAGAQLLAQDYDVFAESGTPVTGGLRANLNN